MENTPQQVPAKSSKVVLAHLSTLSPLALVEDEKVAAKFIQLYDNVHGVKNGSLFYEREKFNYMKLLSEKPELRECTQLSLYGAFLDVAVNGLSFEQGSKPLAYLLSRNVKVSISGQPESRERRAYVQVSPYGELLMRVRAGHVKHADNPVVVYAGDLFEPRISENGTKSVRYEMRTPHTGKQAVGAFIRITRPDNTTDFEWMLEEDILRLRGYSNRQNFGSDTNDKSNALYRSHNGGIDPGFLAAKMIKHAFRTYPKVRIGQFSELKSLEAEAPVIDYGIDAAAATAALPQSSAPESYDVEETTKAQPATVTRTDETEGY